MIFFSNESNKTFPIQILIVCPWAHIYKFKNVNFYWNIIFKDNKYITMKYHL